MVTKNRFFLPALALTVCAGACPAAGGPAQARVSVNKSARARSVQAEAGPFVLFKTAAKEAGRHEAPTDRDGRTDRDESGPLTSLLQAIVPPPIRVEVRPNPVDAGRYVAVLTSPGPQDTAEVVGIVKKAQAAVGDRVFVVSNIRPLAPAILAPAAAPVTLTYTLRFLRGTLPSVSATDPGTSDITGIGTDTAAAALATFLGGVFPGGDTTVTAHENRLVLVGPAAHVSALRQMLALSLDIPSPQVRADIYTIQVNTTPRNRDQAQDKIEEIAAGIQIVRDFIHGSEGGLGAYLATDRAHVPSDPADTAEAAALRKNLFAKMALAGYDRSPDRPLSLIDMLILLTVSDRGRLRQELTPRIGPPPADPKDYHLIDGLEASLHNVGRGLAAGDGREGVVYTRHGAQLGRLIARIQAQIDMARRAGTPVPLFSRMARVYAADPRAKAGDMQGMCDFLDAWHDCQGAFLTGPQPDPDHPEVDPREYPDRLSRQSAATDLLLKEAMDALTADLQTVYFQPLLDWIREDVRGGHAGSTGIDLVGMTSLTVRDRTLGETKGTAESYFKFTPIPHLTMDSLTGAKTLAGSTPATALGALTPLQALALEAALSEDAAVPSYRKIAPGTSLAIRPFVLPDGGSARVQMSLSSTAAADPPAAGGRDIPFDGITSHTVTTEATISAFDLQTVSSFGVQTSAPGDYSWRIPLLDQLPLLGELFHGPRGRDTERQDSIAIVSLTILPRSLDLVPYYVDQAAINKAAKDRAAATGGAGR